MRIYWLGTVEYRAACNLQRNLALLRTESSIPDTLLLMEHPPTVTFGPGSDPRNFLFSQHQLFERGISLCRTDRGGDVTYHGPGQLIGYPIFDLKDHGRDVHDFLRRVEAALMYALVDFGISARRFPPYTGVWVGERKIAAIGVKVSRWVTTHGFALNVSTDLAGFDLIVPCGIRDYGVTSMHSLSERTVEMDQVCRSVVQGLSAAFGLGDSSESTRILNACDLPEGCLVSDTVLPAL